MKRIIIKNIIFSLIPLIIILFILEIGGRVYYFQCHSDSAFALKKIYYKLKRTFIIWQATRKNNALKDIKIPQEALYSDKGKNLLAALMKKYEEYFCLFKDDVKKINAKFTVLYIPSDDYSGKAYRRHKICRTFFITLCKKYNIDFIDLTNEFFKYKSEIITLLPENGHLSRFGNILVANKLKNYILKYSQYRSNYIFHDVKRPKILGDLPPNLNEIWNILPIMPYRVITNSQGFRMKKDITFPRKRKRLRILILGDSYTFGPYVGNHNTYPGLLQKMCSFCDIINAGICGYTICHELSLFEERAQYTEPDIVILQVLDNDIYGLTTYKLFQFQRNGEVVRKNLMDEERDLINSLKIKN